MTKGLITLLAGLALVSPLHAQDEVPPRVRDILQAIRLPATSDELRRQGVPEEEIRAVIVNARQKRLPPSETQVVLDETARTVQETGPIDNFGAFVQSQLDAGLRGRELAAAIHAEHARRGIGKGKRLEGKKGRGPKAQEQARGEVPEAEQAELEVEAEPGQPEQKRGRPDLKGERPDTGKLEEEVRGQRRQVEEKVRGRQGGRPDTAGAAERVRGRGKARPDTTASPGGPR